MVANDAEKNEPILQKFKDYSRSCETYLIPECADFILDCYFNNQDFISTLNGAGLQLQVPDNFPFYINELKMDQAWGRSQEWIPSIDDCVRARSRTSGVVEETVFLDGVCFKIFDVGGQRAERRKWLHVFEDVTGTIFVSSLTDYDHVLYEDRCKNRLMESLDLFEECINSNWLSSTPVLLFLNKKDLFDYKFTNSKIPLNISGLFPTAPEKNDNPNLALEWIANQFKERRKEDLAKQPKKKDLFEAIWFVHVTTATDPENVRTVFNDCKDIILKKNLNRMFGSQ